MTAAIALTKPHSEFLVRLRTIGVTLGARGAVRVGLARQRGGVAAGNGLLNNLIAYWPFDEASGNALDLSGNSRTLTQVNDPGANTGLVYTTAREFVPVNTEYFTRSDSALYGGAAMTVAVWFNAYTLENTPNYHMLCDTLSYGGGWAVGVWGDATQLQAFFQIGKGGGGYYASSHAVLLGDHRNEWHLMVGWLDYAAKTAYSQIDTTAGQVQTDTAYATAGNSYVRFGTRRSATGQWWDGRIGPIAFWNTVLTAAQRTPLYNSGSGLPYASFTT